jgi:pimeloyl-ACP methyl ester carboxylesterase
LKAYRLRSLTLHGNRYAYRRAGSGPVIVLIHGITSDSTTWAEVMPGLAKRFTVIAPDLLGHGGSAKPTGDYSLGAHASLVRDILHQLGHRRATFVGHSLGGGVAMQMAYQFPERCERLILVDSGGLGREVSLLLRAATLPGAEYVLPILTNGRLLDAGRFVGRVMGAVGRGPSTDLRESARGHATLADRVTREAFLRTVRSVIEPSGQRVDATDRLYLAERAPMLFIWGQHDSLIPVSHAHSAHEQVPSSRLEIFADSGHFPQLDESRRFVKVVGDFIETTQPRTFEAESSTGRPVAGSMQMREASAMRSLDA